MVSAVSERMTVRRGAKRAVHDPSDVHAILRAGSIAHVGVNTDSGPLVLPMAYGVSDRNMYLHGALANALLHAAIDHEICATVTIVDGLVVSKTPFNHSMNYRSVVVRGRARAVVDPEEVMEALRLMTDHIVPTWETTRAPSPADVRATRIVALVLDEMSAKVRSGGAVNDSVDEGQAIWSGHIPVSSILGSPVSDADAGADVPEAVLRVVGADIHDR